MASQELPELPAAHDKLVRYFAEYLETPMAELMSPYRKFEARLREIYAQQRNNPILDDPCLNVLPLFNKDTSSIRTRARDLDTESQSQKNKYILSLPDDRRRANGSPAVVESLKEFRHNFAVFSESSLAEMDWSNVVAAGSSVVNCLLPVPTAYNKSKKALRQYYHEKFCPASDVDLFLYGLNETQAIEKIKDIETRIRDAILSEVTVVRTKNAITICSQYPTRHVQIVLRVYKSVSEILSGFDIDCSGAAYDGTQVYCTPRALVAYITQINPSDLTRRSPSYENRLSKYSHRNFEVYWPELDRTRIDPTIFERSFQRTLGLARLLVLERLPTKNAREEYTKKRRQERGRPDLGYRNPYRLYGNIKEIHEDEVADWVDEDEVSNYHTFTVPYGVKFHAKKVEKLCYTKDLLLNAEWNQPKEREVYLHRHPAFFGRVEDIIRDCCGTCPKPETPEEIEIAQTESEIYVSGNVSFRIDDPGRQQIGSFNPLTEDDWTEMAYVGNTAVLCQAIVDGDLEHVEDWMAREGADPNTRDYTGRTPLHLAVSSSTPEVVKCLVDSGARLIARLADGRTALHLAAARGSVEMVRILLEKSNANEEEEEEKQDHRRKARDNAVEHASENCHKSDDGNEGEDDSDAELVDDDSCSDDGVRSTTTGSFVQVQRKQDSDNGQALLLDDDQNDPDFYKIDIVAWDSKCSALHLAILGGHCDVVKLLCQEFGADVLLPVKIGDGSNYNPNTAILTLVLALALPVEKAIQMSETLLTLGATSSQADANGVTAFHRYVQNGTHELIDALCDTDKLGLKTAINHLALTETSWNPKATSPLLTAIEQEDPILVLKLLEAGASPEIDFDTWLKGAKLSFEYQLGSYDHNRGKFEDGTEQPLLVAIQSSHPATAIDLLAKGADPNIITKSSHNVIRHPSARSYRRGQCQSALDVARDLLSKLRTYEEDKPIHRSAQGTRRFGAGFTGSMLLRPEKPRETDQFLANFHEGTYQHWVVVSDIAAQFSAYESALIRFNEEKRSQANLQGRLEKEEAIRGTISQLEDVEKALVSKGAKTFTELYPDIQSPPNPSAPSHEKFSLPYQLTFSFSNVKDVTESRKNAYIKLFEAAWSGDLDTIKELTLAPWGADKKDPPLKIAVFDGRGNNPFSLAFLKGHYDVAKAVLEVAQVQWAPKEEKKTRFTMRKNLDADDDEYEESDEESGDEPEIHQEIIDDQLTIDNIGQVSMQVQSETLPTSPISWNASTFTLRDGKPAESKGKQALLSFAISQNDELRFKLLLELAIRYASQNHEPEDKEVEESGRFYKFPQNDFIRAVQLGRTNMLAGAIKRTGAGIHLEHLVKKTGMEMKVKPRYYQRLTVYGKKRADWAKAGRNLMVKPTGTKVPPLLTAALEGSLESVEWFLSDSPVRHYLGSGKSKTAREDPRLKHLKEAPGGFDRAIMKWLGVQNDLVIHCLVLGPLGKDTNHLIEYLIKVCPSSIEARSHAGYTPLFLACLLGRVDFAKTLIGAGADQAVKAKDFNNIIHACLTNKPRIEPLGEMLQIIDPELRSHMFCQKNNLTHGGDTPIHFWLKNANANTNDNPRHPHRVFLGRGKTIKRGAQENADNVKLLHMLLDFSRGGELEMLNGSGDTMLHTAVVRSLPGHCRVLLEKNPTLLYRENTVGRTPGEIAYDRFINAKVEQPESIETSRRGTWANILISEATVSFAPADDNKPTRTLRERTWDVIEEYLARTDGKRRLVSLNEANDVAKRLGEAYSSRRYYGQEMVKAADDDDDEEKKPEESDVVTERYDSLKSQPWESRRA